jgi:hypothetical protein
MCLTLSKKFYLIMLFWVRYKITHRIESKLEIEDVVVEDENWIRRIVESRFCIIYSASSCLVWRSHFESLSRSRSSRMLFTQTCELIVVASCLILNSRRIIFNASNQFLLISKKICRSECRTHQINCWKWSKNSRKKTRA